MGPPTKLLERIVIWFVWLFGAVVALVGVSAVALKLFVHFDGERRRARDDPHFAETYFKDRVSFVSVRATRRWHPRGAGPMACTFAIVDLAPAPGPVRDDAAWQSGWGGRWQETPADHPGRNNRDALLECAPDFDDETNRKLRAAVTEPGSWYARDGVGEDVYVYSVPQGIAAFIRYGD